MLCGGGFIFIYFFFAPPAAPLATPDVPERRRPNSQLSIVLVGLLRGGFGVLQVAHLRLSFSFFDVKPPFAAVCPRLFPRNTHRDTHQANL